MSHPNADRKNELLQKLAGIAVYEFDGYHADNLNEMQNRHHAVISAVADYLDADAAAFAEAAGVKFNKTQIGEQLDLAFKDFIHPEYEEKREILRAEEAQSRGWGNAYDRGRQIVEAA